MAVSRRRQFSTEKGICQMQSNAITQLPDPSGFSADPFKDVIRDGARKMIEQAIHAELATLMAAFSGEIAARVSATAALSASSPSPLSPAAYHSPPAHPVPNPAPATNPHNHAGRHRSAGALEKM